VTRKSVSLRGGLPVVLCVTAFLASTATGAVGDVATPAPETGTAATIPRIALHLDRETEERILALVPEKISDAEVQSVLARGPSPRIINLQGVAGLVTMAPFAEFLIAMGYPEERIRNPRDGALSYNSSGNSAQLAGALAWYYEREAMMPMLIGHSQGGMMAVRVLYELAGDFGHPLFVWNPVRDEAEERSSITDPLSGRERPIIGLHVPYAAAIATGTLPRIWLGQWDMVQRLHKIPNTVTEFVAYSLEWDLLAGNFGRAEPYRAIGDAEVRNITVPWAAGHTGVVFAKPLAVNPTTRAWINDYIPSPELAPLPTDAGVDLANLVHSADIWYSVKKHWCLEAQRLIRAWRQGQAAQQ
jgi:hypothetical protein